MKKVSYLIYVFVFTLILFSFTSFKMSTKYKRYDVESGHISYVYKGKAKGTKTVYFKDWGMKEIQIDHMDIEVFGMKQKTRQIILLEGEKITIHNKTNKNTYSELNKDLISLKKDYPGQFNLSDASFEELKSIGGNFIGKIKFLNKDCHQWVTNGSKQYFWKGIPLKNEVEVVGIKIVMEATEIKTDISIHDSIFTLPSITENSISSK